MGPSLIAAVASAAPPPSGGVERAGVFRQAEALRAAVAAAPEGLPVDGLPALAARLGPLGSDEAAALESRLREDIVLRRAILEMLARRRDWRAEASGPFVVWWDPRRTERPDEPALARLAGALRDACARHEVAEPRGVPYVLDGEARGARVFDRDDVRWGIVTSEPEDVVAVARLVLLELGDLPYLLAPLALLDGRCGGDLACRAAFVEQARAEVLAARYVPFAEGVQTGTVASTADPATWSALLVLDELERRHGVSPSALLRLLTRDEVARGRAEAELRRAVGRSPRQVDRAVLRSLAAWAEARRRSAARGMSAVDPG